MPVGPCIPIFAACTIPAAGKPNFTIKQGHMEVGIGHHGEPGVAVMPTKPAREMADTLHNLAVVREKEQLHADAVRLQNRATMILGLR